MKKKPLVCMLLIAFVLTFLLPVQAMAATQNFPDIKGHWAENYISQLAASAYVKGYLDGKFKPDNNMSKAEFITVLIASMGTSATDKTTNNYSDTSKHWAKAQINEAVKLGILVPSEDSSGFGPDEAIKRSQAAAFLVRALGKSPDSNPVSFADKATIEKSMYKEFIKTASDLGLISGFPDGNFDPFASMTRAQVCTVIVKFINNLNGTSGSLPAPNTTSTGGNINTITIGAQSYPINSTPIYFSIDFHDIRASSINAGSTSFSLNGLHTINLNSESNNPDIIVNNNRYGVKNYMISGNKMLVTASCRKFNKINSGTYTFGSDFVKLYINSANSEHYLSDMEISDEYNVKIAGKTYKLNQDKITVELNQDFYDIKKITLGDNDTIAQLSKTDPVIFNGMSMSDIMAIFTGTTTLNTAQISTIDFILGGKRYKMSQVIMDAKGNFTANSTNYSPVDVIMIIDGTQYKINNVAVTNSKFIFYCGEGSTHEWVVINDEYYDFDDVRILWSSSLYDLNEVMVVGRNLLRIKGKQYDLDSSFKVRFGNKVYDIERIEYNSSLGVTEIRTGSLSSSNLANQPAKYVFYRNTSIYQEGTNNATLYVNGSWIDFDEILIIDPSHMSYKNTNYDLIGTRIKISKIEFKIVDTSWHGLTQVLDLYMEET
ncbi:MAG: S-layer homology domain-containing protein [Syntrophomonadaceae bacterium]|nr:S-layer homology domain-containing protein [Syntrophomonadaceae bacterium]MDD3023392.1 S-layer homology domain-containing protein [Syntrophomonadaceae bacterium]